MALRPAGKTLSSLTGIVVLAAVLWFLLNFLYAPSCGRFACSFEPAWLPRAQAVVADGCPEGLDGAASDAGWAAARIESIADAKVTTILAYDEDGTEYRFRSGEDEDELRVSRALEELKYPPDRSGRYPAAAHAEAKAAFWMRETGTTLMVAVINNSKGVCADSLQSCTAIVSALLPTGSVLVVWEPGKAVPRKLEGR